MTLKLDWRRVRLGLVGLGLVGTDRTGTGNQDSLEGGGRRRLFLKEFWMVFGLYTGQSKKPL